MSRITKGRRWLLLVAATVCLAGTGCSIPERGEAVPRVDTVRAMPLGIPNARFYADGDPRLMVEEGMQSGVREAAALRAEGKMPTRPPPAYFLAVSGGGDNGAFGAGIMNGWTAVGTRPTFKMVTGVSTGALIAPFAFLGSDYDAQLREVYTTMTPDKVFRMRGLTAALFDDAMADTGPLAQIIATYADQKMFDAIAAEYNKGRLLMIGTTDLDAQRPVIWNIGAIAASGHPGALDLFRKILRASAAIPGAFQPVLIDVELDGKKYQELHVDGGAIAQLFLYPPSIDMSASNIKRERRAYIIRNARLDPDYAMAERRTITIAGRAIATMLAASGVNDVLRTYFVSQRDKVDYNLTYIGRDFNFPKKGEFDQAYMNALYEYGVREIVEGRAWHKAPPGLGSSTSVPTR
ncbi:patatin-like phospholipase family protein [Reyranella sp.]|uniref:patatin-like phospholipase family protein n=1 Tax=Reyranella sp. TaxID=1929291 RepID=UPI00271A4C2F|nr:patatin-like phospholipase family protein [Reyranella sp.]MDO8977333.1 patatin-like phospholipase family protein [Reyranella sp.]